MLLYIHGLNGYLPCCLHSRLTAIVFADNPSVKIKEHKSLFAVPAQLASSKPGIPTKRLFFFPSVFSNYLSPTPNTLFIDASVIGLLIIDFLNLSETFTEVLKSAGLVVNSSFDYDLNLGFETLALTKIIILSLI